MTGAAFGEVDIDLLADYIGGALAGTPDESAVAARIADDPAWRTAYASLREGMALVGVELGRLGPEPMPTDLAGRLEALFTSPIAEPSPIPAELAAPTTPRLALVRDSAASGDGENPVPDPGVDRRARERATRARWAGRLRWAAPVAVAAGVLAFVGFGLDYLRVDSADDAGSASTNLAREAAPNAAPFSSGEVILHSGTNYTLATLAGAQQWTASGHAGVEPYVATDRSSVEASKRADDRSLGGVPALQRLADRAALQDCLDAIERENAGGTIVMQSVDYARFDGSPAVVVLFSAANGMWAWASGPACGTPGGGADTLGHVPVR